MSRFLCVFVLTSLLMLGLGSRSPASACSCATTTVSEVFEGSDAVFIGRVVNMEVIHVEDGVATIEATVQRGRVYKGDVPEKVVFTTSNGCCYCALMYTIAETYLFFADEHDGSLDTNACSRTKPVSEAKEDLVFLEEQSTARQP